MSPKQGAQGWLRIEDLGSALVVNGGVSGPARISFYTVYLLLYSFWSRAAQDQQQENDQKESKLY